MKPMEYCDIIHHSTLNFRGRPQGMRQPLVMGILNVTGDSFFDGGRYTTETRIVQRAQQMLDDGADIIDIGAASSRPGAADIPGEQERETIAKTAKLLLEQFPYIVISVDTWRASVAEEAVRNGAAMVNDISGGTFDERMIPLIGALQVPYVVMHTPAKPSVMQQYTDYSDLLPEMLRFFDRQINKLQQHFVHDIILDPGFGFGKTLQQNYFLLNNLDAFKMFNLPLLVGLSRKSMIYNILDGTPKDAINGTTVLNTQALLQGAAILRVHDVKEAVEVRRLVSAAK